MKKLTEQELLSQLKEIRETKQEQEKRELDEATDAAFERCKDATYIKNVSDYPNYITYRKIDNLIQDIESDMHVNHVDVWERIILSFRLDDENTFFQKGQTIRVTADISTFTKIKPTKNSYEYVQQDDYPITEIEYNKARDFAIAQTNLFKEYFSK